MATIIFIHRLFIYPILRPQNKPAILEVVAVLEAVHSLILVFEPQFSRTLAAIKLDLGRSILAVVARMVTLAELVELHYHVL